jgi:hypothetical protein
LCCHEASKFDSAVAFAARKTGRDTANERAKGQLIAQLF